MNNTLHHKKTRSASSPDFAVEPLHFDLEDVAIVRDYGRVRLRPIHLEDEAKMIRFHEKLSEESIYLRYFEHISLDTRTLHERLARVCVNTEDSFAIVAERHAVTLHPAEILGVGRLTTTETAGEAEFALLMADEVQGGNLPKWTLKRVMRIAEAYGFQSLRGELLAEDRDAIELCRGLGFNLRVVPENGTVMVSHWL